MSETLTLTNQRYANKGAITITIEQACDSEPQALLTPAEVAECYNVSESQLSKWRQKLEGPKYTKANGRGAITYKPEDVEAWLANPRYPGWQKARAGAMTDYSKMPASAIRAEIRGLSKQPMPSAKANAEITALSNELERRGLVCKLSPKAKTLKHTTRRLSRLNDQYAK